MTTTTARPISQAPPSGTRVALVVARSEARRIGRSPLFLLGLGLSVLFGWGIFRGTDSRDGWTGDEYSAVPVLFVPLLIATAILVAAAFHRERDPVGLEAPVGATVRTTGLLLGAASVVALVGLLTLGLAAYVARVDGFDLGEEPGRTLHARFTAFELAQHVALTGLAVATGAAAGRRLATRATASLVLFAGWFPTMFVYWVFQVPTIVPFSIVQVQPINLRVAAPDTDPLALPGEWLLTPPDEYQDYWGRSFVSNGLAGWHDLWLVGLTCLFLAMVFAGRWRRRLLLAGAVMSAVSIGAQYWVIP